jgi:hypothetical protein
MQQLSLAAGLLSSSSSFTGTFLGETVRARFLAGEGGFTDGLDVHGRLLARDAILSEASDAAVATEAAEARAEADRIQVECDGGLNKLAACNEPTEGIPSEGRKAAPKTTCVICVSGADGDAIGL